MRKKINYNEVIRLRKMGLTVKQVMDRLDISKASVKRISRKMGYNKTKNKIGRPQKVSPKTILDLHSEGKSIPSICKELNISRTTAYDSLNKLGEELKGKGGRTLGSKKLDEKTIDFIVFLNDKGISKSIISEILDISPATVYSYLRDKKMIELSKGRSVVHKKIRELYSKGMTSSEISDAMNINQSLVSYAIRGYKSGVPSLFDNYKEMFCPHCGKKFIIEEAE